MTKQAVVARFVDWSEAQIARGLLESNGIACVVGDSNMTAIEWGINLGQGGIRLTVLDDADAPQARQLLDEVRRGQMADTLERFDAAGAGEEAAVERCPVCRSADIFHPRSLGSAIVTNILAAPPPLLAGRQRHCRACGTDWTAAE
jgi:hypothetical protein